MNSLNSKTRILVARPDRIGDVILSTPVFEVIKRHYPNSRLTILVQANIAPLLTGLSCVDDVMIYDPKGKHAGFRGFLRLLQEIRAKRFRIAVVLQSPLKIAAAVFFSGVRYRVGPLSKAHSFIFFNRGIRQRRSQVEMHEADYNLQLLRKLGIRVGARNVPTAIAVPEADRAAALAFLKKSGWEPQTARATHAGVAATVQEEPQTARATHEGALILVHPGMGGSALNWPESHYIELVRGLLREGRHVVLTGGAAEAELIQRISESVGVQREKLIIYTAGQADGVGMLAGLMSWASVVIAPSTGPLHIAVALRKPVVSFYPPIRVQSAIRWGPYLREESQASVLVPEVYCGEDFKCRGNLCNYFPCMKSIPVAEALEKVNSHLS